MGSTIFNIRILFEYDHFSYIGYIVIILIFCHIVWICDTSNRISKNNTTSRKSTFPIFTINSIIILDMVFMY